MKILILIATLFLSANAFADYKIFIQNAKLELPVGDSVGSPDPEPWQPPSGVPAMHPNGVTVACLNMPNGAEFDLNDKPYKVFYTKEEAAENADIACTSNITDMSEMFKNLTDFNSDISHWDTSNVTDMKSVFYSAQSFNQDISQWDTSKVTNMSYMFRATDAFNQDISGWDISNVLNMDYMFYDADGFQYNLNDWCVSRFSQEPSGFNISASFFSSDKEPLWGSSCN